MTTLADKAILSGADNHPPMLEKDMYDSWKSIIELYMMNRQHGRMILESVDNGPLIWLSIEENEVTRPTKNSELSATETIQADCDIKQHIQFSKTTTSRKESAMPSSKQSNVVNHSETEITSDSNIIPYSQYLIESQQASCFQNPFYLKKAQQLEPKLYDGNVIKNTSAIVILDSEETLMLAKESHSKILLKQKDHMMLEKKVNTTPVDYDNSVNSLEPTLSSRPTKVEVPKELPKVSMVNTSLKKLKYHLAGFD
ncbi:hypothetical protein Tco_0534561 [Tanacetum coccineum]